MHRRSIPLLAGTALALAPLSGAGQERMEGPEFRFDEQIAPGDWLRVFTVNGHVEVVESEGPVAEVFAEATRDPEDIVYELHRDADGITICALRTERSRCSREGIRSRGDGWRGRSRARANVTVRLPRGVHLRVGSGNGDLDVEGASGEVVAGTGNGDVTVLESGGEVDASTGNGEVEVEGARGPVEASSGNGAIRVATSLGPVNASTGNGRIEVRMESVAAASEMELSSGNGSIVLELPADFEGRFIADRGHGGFESDFPIQLSRGGRGGRWDGMIGDGDVAIRASTGNGSVELRAIPR